MHIIRPAHTSEAETLTDIAVRSESYWGYDSAFMDRFKQLYSVTEEFINTCPTYVLLEKDTVIGFYGISADISATELEFLYVDPAHIGKGYGKVLWNHMLGVCKERGIGEISLVTSPEAKQFYIRLGAVPRGEVESAVVKGRMIPRLCYRLV